MLHARASQFLEAQECFDAYTLFLKDAVPPLKPYRACFSVRSFARLGIVPRTLCGLVGVKNLQLRRRIKDGRVART